MSGSLAAIENATVESRQARSDESVERVVGRERELLERRERTQAVASLAAGPRTAALDLQRNESRESSERGGVFDAHRLRLERVFAARSLARNVPNLETRERASVGADLQQQRRPHLRIDRTVGERERAQTRRPRRLQQCTGDGAILAEP